MTDKKIQYRSGYKYQLAKDYRIKTTLKPKAAVDNQFIALDKRGQLTVKSGYAWDGPSGPLKDTEHNLRASLVHDAFYQLIRKKKLTITKDRDKADKLFQKMCRQDGVPSLLARIYYEVLKKFGRSAAMNEKKEHHAP